MNDMSHTFSLLSRGYGTWDGIAKVDRSEARTPDYFSLDDFYLPSIEKKYKKPDDAKNYAPILYQNKPFTLPKVEDPTSNPVSYVPKTYTTRKGALLLYAEDYFIPISPKKIRKKKRKQKAQSAVIFNTLGDLRDSVLNYKKNGGDPLFLYLLQKNYSNYRERAIKPGFSPKRYITNLRRILQEDSWNKHATKGSLSNSESDFLPLPDKPHPYSTMSLPPISPSGSMVGSFNFYKSGMSTGAASLISIDSDDVLEYAPSYRALSPLESLSERLSEVVMIPLRKDNRYATLNSRQKAELLSQLLVHSTLQGDSDIQGWATDLQTEILDIELESGPLLPRALGKGKTNKGGLKSAHHFASRLPPIQSAGAHSTPPSISTVSTSQSTYEAVDLNTVGKDYISEPMKLDILDPSDLELFVTDDHSKGDVVTDIEMKSSAEVESNLGSILSGLNSHSSKDFDNSGSEEVFDVNKLSTDSYTNLEKHSEGNEKLQMELESSRSGTLDNLRSGSLDNLVAAKESIELKQRLDSREHEDRNAVGVDSSVSKTGTSKINGPPMEAKDTKTAGSESEATGKSYAPLLKRLSVDELHGHANVVVSRVLSRPQSGMSFDADVKEAKLMWADRLFRIIGSSSKEPRVMSAVCSPTKQIIPEEPCSDDSITPNDADRAGLATHKTKDRKISQSASPSTAALRETLKISGSDIKLELLKDVDGLSDKINKISTKENSEIQDRIEDGHIDREPCDVKEEVLEDVDNLSDRTNKMSAKEKPEISNRIKAGHIYYEPSTKEDVGSTQGRESPGPTKSIQSERVSLSDIQMDIVSIVTGQENTANYEKADLVSDQEPEDDENFREAVLSVLSEHSDKVFTVLPEDKPEPEAADERKTSSGKGKSKSGKMKSGKKKSSTSTPPFQVPTKPKAEKPPTGLQNSVPKPKTKSTKPKVKKGTKKVPKVKPTGKKSPAKETEVQKLEEDLSPPVRVNSETGEKEPEVFNAVSPVSLLSSNKSETGLSKSIENIASPEEALVSPVAELPKLIRRPEQKEQKEEPDQKEEEAAKVRELEDQKAKDAKAQRKAERAAAAERRRLEVEKKRKEREEAKRKALEEEARLERLRMEEEEAMQRREEERRRIREEKEEEKRRKAEFEKEQERLALAKLEREKRQREEWRRKQQELAEKRKREEELRREQEKIEAEIAAAARREQEEKLKAMEESERRAFEERMKREEEELKKRLELQRLKEEEERRIREEQRRKHQEQLALLRQKQLQRQLFIAGLFKEENYLTFNQKMSRAFTYSYYAIMPWSYLKHLKPVPALVPGSTSDALVPDIDEEDVTTPIE